MESSEIQQLKENLMAHSVHVKEGKSVLSRLKYSYKNVSTRVSAYAKINVMSAAITTLSR